MILVWGFRFSPALGRLRTRRAYCPTQEWADGVSEIFRADGWTVEVLYPLEKK